MNIKFLGTSAGELYPGIWCNCRNCEAARFGGADARRQSASLYIESRGCNLLVDFPPEIASQALRHKVPLAALQHLLVTHSHGDHWHPYQLRWRGKPAVQVEPYSPPPLQYGGPRFTTLENLQIWGNGAVEGILRRELGEYLADYELEFHRVGSGSVFQAGHLLVYAAAANHDVGKEEALHYVIQADSVTMLYGLDGDTFLPETCERLRSFYFDLVVLESTYGNGDGGNHRNFNRLISEACWFRDEGLLKPNGKIVATHFSPHHCPPHLETKGYLEQHQIEAACDGMEINI